MGLRRTVMLVAGAVVGVVAAVAMWRYLGGAEERAYGNARLVKVWVVNQDIARGAPGEKALDEGWIGEDEIPQKFRPSTAVTDIDSIRGKVAFTNLAPGQIVVDGFFVEPTVASTSFAQRIPSGQVALSIRVDDTHGVANLIAPGDKVNVMTPVGDGMETLYQNVNVIAVGRSPAPVPGENPASDSGDAGLITFAVPPQAAERIALAANTTDKLYLALVPPDNQPVPVAPVSSAALIGGSLSPYG